ncbi:MAG: hypothetical protein HRT88_00775 [Lentisphaeraceae bacterium]|nr:hypothetical protein [Lentisphaeraceae bacterium]
MTEKVESKPSRQEQIEAINNWRSFVCEHSKEELSVILARADRKSLKRFFQAVAAAYDLRDIETTPDFSVFKK